jgi:hypothetical protein
VTPAAVALLATAAIAAGCGGGGRHVRSSTPAPFKPDVGTNVARIGGKSPADVASSALLAVYPDAAHQPGGLVLTPQNDWRQAVVAAQFAAGPLAGAIIPTAGAFLPPGPSDLVTRLNPSGFPRAQGLQSLILGKPGNDVLSALQSRGLHLTVLNAPSAEELTLKTIPFRGGWAHSYSDEVVVVSSEARDYALPAAAWSAYSGDTVAFVTHDSVPDATRRVLVQREKLRLQKPTIYVIGPPAVISDAVVGQLSQYGPVKRVAGDSPAATAVALARYKDRKTGFGWGLRRGPASVAVLDRRDWANVFGAFALAGAGPQTPLLLIDGADSLPSAVVRYLDELRNASGNQGLVLGDRSSVGPGVLQRLDRLLSAGSPST